MANFNLTLYLKVVKQHCYLWPILFLFSGCVSIEKWTGKRNIERLQKRYEINLEQLKNNAQDQIRIVIVIDVFRAFTTASYILERHPRTYMLASRSSVISRLAKKLKNPILIGKPEKDINLKYDIPNSPTRVTELSITGRDILHRTEAGAKGVLFAKEADIVLVAGFVNAAATAKYISTLPNFKVTILPMGHEGTSPSLEDNICAKYIEALINGNQMKLSNFTLKLKKGPGKYFFSKDQWQYPCEDFERCLELNHFNFVIRAKVIDNDYAILTLFN